MNVAVAIESTFRFAQNTLTHEDLDVAGSMNIENLLTDSRTLHSVSCSSKKRALEKLSELIAHNDSTIDSSLLFEQLIERERLGSTGIGSGIAIPHCRFNTNGHTIGALMTLETAIDFDSIDNKPVDIVFAMLVPEDGADEHLKTLASLAELFQQTEFLSSLRQAKSDSDLFTRAIAASA